MTFKEYWPYKSKVEGVKLFWVADGCNFVDV